MRQPYKVESSFSFSCSFSFSEVSGVFYFFSVSHHRLIDQPRAATYQIVLSIWSMLTLYAILHDQYIVWIAPEHFTLYHEPLGDLENPALIATVYAIRAGLGPGFFWGLAAAFFALSGTRPLMPVRLVLLSALVAIICIEVISASSGLWVWLSGRLVYPQSFYPDDDSLVLVTQTIQVTCYFSGAVGAVMHLTWISWWRRRRDS